MEDIFPSTRSPDFNIISLIFIALVKNIFFYRSRYSLVKTVFFTIKSAFKSRPLHLIPKKEKKRRFIGDLAVVLTMETVPKTIEATNYKMLCFLVTLWILSLAIVLSKDNCPCYLRLLFHKVCPRYP